MASNSTEICIAVCTRNRADLLKSALESLATLKSSQNFSFHVLVVDNASEPATGEVVRDAAERYRSLQIRSVLEPEVGFAPARNRAISDCEADWIAFFDDDQIAEPDWLIELWKCRVRRDVECVGGAVRLRLMDSSFEPGPFCRAMLGETDPLQSERPYGPHFEPGTGNLLVSRQLVLDCGGFSKENVGRGEDSRLFTKLHTQGHAAWFTPEAVITHVILPPRNQPAAYLELAKASSNAGDLGWFRWGWRLPLVCLLRLISYLLVDVPLMGWTWLFGSESKHVDKACAARFRLHRSLSDLQYSVQRLTQGQ